MNASHPLISVVVPTFERRASLARLLEALNEQTRVGDMEVIVVDDGSRDDTAAWLARFQPRYPLRVLEQAHGGPGAARNRGIAEARGELIVFLDDDVVPEPDLIAGHMAAHNAAPNSVVCGPMLPPAGWARPAWIRWEEQKLVDQYVLMTRGVYTCTYRQFFTGNASLLRAPLLTAGGFDPSFARAEDVELGYRLHLAGLGFVFEPAARVWHYPQRSFAAWRQAAYRYGQADVRMHRNLGGPQLDIACREFHSRHRLSRTLVRLCMGSTARFRGATFGLAFMTRAANRRGLHRIADAALSGLFSLCYWQGASDALGGPVAIWAAVAKHRPRLATGAIS